MLHSGTYYCRCFYFVRFVQRNLKKAPKGAFTIYAKVNLV
ncbi:hypothetical protein WI0192307A01_CDS0013 [Salmonella phage VT223]